VAEREAPAWRRSDRCGEAGTCVEVAVTPDAVLVRDGKDPDGPHLSLTYGAWHALLAGLRAGAFDR
jgi:hypothetical protein